MITVESTARAWSRQAKFWELVVMTLSLLAVIGGGLMKIYLEVHDTGIKIATLDDVTRRVTLLESWRNTREQVAIERRKELDNWEHRQQNDEATINAITSEYAVIVERLNNLQRLAEHAPRR